jgi:hypothetical protein
MEAEARPVVFASRSHYVGITEISTRLNLAVRVLAKAE